MISQIASRVLSDGIMSDSEYQLVLDEVELFVDQKEDIRRQTMQALEHSARKEALVDGHVDCKLTAC